MTSTANVTVTPEAIKAAEGLKKAMKGVGTDEATLIQTLCSVPAAQAAQITHAYKAHYATDLAEDIEKETKGDFGKFLCRIVRGQVDCDVRDLNRALYPEKDGTGEPDKETLIELLTGRTNGELKAIQKAYQAKYDVPLADVIKSKLKDDFEKFVSTTLQATRDESPPSSSAADAINADVDALFKAGTGKFGTDSAVFIDLICKRGVGHLQKVFQAYEARYKMGIEKVVMKEFTGDMEMALLAQVRLIINRPLAIARQLESSMAGIGTNEKKLVRLVTRYRDPSIMNVIESEYQKEFGKTLIKRIEGEISGDLRKAVVAVVGKA